MTINDFAFPSDSNVAGPAGLTKREWFAGMALAVASNWNLEDEEDTAKLCYRIADAMVAEGKK